MKRKGGWRVGHASREGREWSREIAVQLGMLGKKRRVNFSALTYSSSSSSGGSNKLQGFQTARSSPQQEAEAQDEVQNSD